MLDLAETIWRDHEIQGVPASGPFRPEKASIRAWGVYLESFLRGAQAGGGIVFPTLGYASLHLDYAENQLAWIVEDGINSGIYRKSGSTGLGAWTKIANLPYSYARAINSGAGTANAMVAGFDTQPPGSSDALISVNATATNTSSPVTIAFDGGTALTIKTSSGNDVPIGGITAGMMLIGTMVGSNFRLVSDLATSANVAAAETARVAAQAAADAAIGATGVADFPTVAAAAATTIPSGKQFLRVAGYAASGDGGAALYKKVGSEPSHSAKIHSTDGAWWEIAESVISVKMLGAVSDYDPSADTGTDATAAFVAAHGVGRTVYVPRGRYLVTNQITKGVKNQITYGDGRWATEVHVNTRILGKGAAGVFVSTDIATELRDLAIVFRQPDSFVYSDMHAYPPAHSGRDIPGHQIRRVRISRAMTGLDWLDNCGQSVVDDLLISAFDKNIAIDGALDSVRINDLHCWPVDLTSNQLNVFLLDTCIGVSVGRADDLKIANGLFFNGQPFEFFSGSRSNAGPSFATIINSDFDGYRGIKISAGTVNVIGGFQSCADSSMVKLNQTGGSVIYSAVDFFIRASFAETTGLFQIDGGSAIFVACSYDRAAQDLCMWQLKSGQLSITGGRIIHDPGITATYAFIACASGTQATVTGVSLSALTGSASFFKALGDDPHVVTGNALDGHGFTLNAGYSAGLYSGNRQRAGKDYAGSLFVGGDRRVFFTGLLDGSGACAIVHGLTNGHRTAQFVLGYYRGASGEMRALTLVGLDGTTAQFSGGTNGAPYRITIVYTGTIQSGW